MALFTCWNLGTSLHCSNIFCYYAFEPGSHIMSKPTKRISFLCYERMAQCHTLLRQGRMVVLWFFVSAQGLGKLIILETLISSGHLISECWHKFVQQISQINHFCILFFGSRLGSNPCPDPTKLRTVYPIIIHQLCLWLWLENMNINQAKPSVYVYLL